MQPPPLNPHTCISIRCGNHDYAHAQAQMKVGKTRREEQTTLYGIYTV